MSYALLIRFCSIDAARNCFEWIQNNPIKKGTEIELIEFGKKDNEARSKT